MRTAPHAQTSRTITGVLSDGATWMAEVPIKWNGKALLYAHGYDSSQRALESAPAVVRAELLKKGYALVASAYPRLGWVVAEAVPSQLLALDAFAMRVGPPVSTIAWGVGMGGLITTALAELHPERIHGAIALCAASAGAIPMMNMALDGAFALTKLLLPASVTVPITHVQRGDVTVAIAIVGMIKDLAQSTTAGRARLALAGVLGGVPGWTDPDCPRPSTTDYWAQQEQLARVMPAAVFLPRDDLEARAGGAGSGNVGVDYRKLLVQSRRQEMVEHLYRDANIDLQQDLDRLNDAPRMGVDPAAVTYLQSHFTPSGRIGVPVLTLHTIGDGGISPLLQRSYVDTVKNAGKSELIAEGWVERAGHCNMTCSEILAALRALESRLVTGVWHVAPAALNEGSTPDDSKFVEFSASPLPRGTEPRQKGDRPHLTMQRAQ